MKKIREKWRKKYKSLFFKNLCQQNCKTHLICLLNRISVYELVFYFKLKVYILCIIHYSPSFTLCIQNINNTNCNSKSINCDLSSIWLQVHTAVFNFFMFSLKQEIHPLINCCTEQRIIILVKKISQSLFMISIFPICLRHYLF